MLDLATLSDDDLAGAAQLEGDERLAEQSRRYERRMHGCAHHMVAPSEVDDAAQEIAGR